MYLRILGGGKSINTYNRLKLRVNSYIFEYMSCATVMTRVDMILVLYGCVKPSTDSRQWTIQPVMPLWSCMWFECINKSIGNTIKANRDMITEYDIRIFFMFTYEKYKLSLSSRSSPWSLSVVEW